MVRYKFDVMRRYPVSFRAIWHAMARFRSGIPFRFVCFGIFRNRDFALLLKFCGSNGAIRANYDVIVFCDGL